MTPEQEAMEILMLFGKDGCTIADSGGKDSSVLKRIEVFQALDGRPECGWSAVV